MTWPQTINGNTYTESMFIGYNHLTNFPNIIEDIAEVGAAATGAAEDAKTAGGFTYLFDTTTTAGDPGAGKLRLNNATIASATAMYISETTNASQAIASIIQSWDDSTSTIKGFLRISKQSDLSVFALFSVSGSVSDGGSYDTLTLSYVGGNGSFALNDPLTVQFARNGDKGDTGATGAAGADGAGFTRAPMTSTGSANAYVLTPVTPISSYSDQQVFVFEANFANTGAATLNISGLGAKAIRKNFDEVLVANDIKTGQLIQVAYEAGTDRFQMMNNPGNIITTERANALIANTLAVQDYVIGFFDYDCLLSYASLISESGTGTISLYLSSDRTSASGTVITGASALSVSSTISQNSLTANNTVSSASPKYLIAKCTASTSLKNTVVSMKIVKNMDD